jgi:hypothetical protein
MARVRVGGVQNQKCAGLRFQQRTALFEMLDGGSAIAALAEQNRQHGMASRITGAQLQHLLQERNRCNIARLVFQLGCAFQGRKVFRRNLERIAKRS